MLESHLFAIIKVKGIANNTGYNFCVLNILWCKHVKCQKMWNLDHGENYRIYGVYTTNWEKKFDSKNIGSGKKKIVKDKLLYFLILWESQNLWYWLRLLSAASVCFYLNCQSNSISKYENFIVYKENFFLLL